MIEKKNNIFLSLTFVTFRVLELKLPHRLVPARPHEQEAFTTGASRVSNGKTIASHLTFYLLFVILFVSLIELHVVIHAPETFVKLSRVFCFDKNHFYTKINKMATSCNRSRCAV